MDGGLRLAGRTLGLAVALVLLPAVVEAAKPPPPAGFEQRIIYAAVEVDRPQPGINFIHQIDCPKGWVANAGGIETDATGSFQLVNGFSVGEYQRVLETGPPYSDARFEFWLQNHSKEKQTVTLWVSCIRPKAAPPPKPIVKSAAFDIPLFGVNKIRVQCPRGTQPVGYGYSLLGPNLQPPRVVVRGAADADAAPRVVASNATARGHDVTFSAGSQEVQGRLLELCYPAKMTTRGGGKRQVTIDRREVAGNAPPGLSSMTAGCGKGRIALGTPGFSASPGIRVDPSISPTGDAQLRFSNPMDGTVPVKAYLACTRGRLVDFQRIAVTTTVGPPVITQGP